MQILKIILLLIGVSFHIQAKESIKQFDSHIVINKDSTITVTENITVMVEGKNIKRGIFRDLPLKRMNKSGAISTIGLKVLSVLRDERKENYKLESISGGKRIKIGNKDRYLKKGIHHFEITYQTSRQLRLQENGKIELFWNITGDGWAFPIEKSSASFELATDFPEKLEFFTAYTGKTGTRGEDFSVKSESHIVTLDLTRSLAPREGWSVAVQFPKSEVLIPTGFKAFMLDMKLLNKTQELLWLLLTLFCSFGIWYIHGIDPKRKSIFPHFESPKEMSPAKLNYIYLGKYSNDALSSALINMAVKGAIEINQEGTLTVLPIENNEEALKLLTSEEKILYNELCKGGGTKFSRFNRTILMSAKKAFTKDLEQSSKKYHSKNLVYSFLAGGLAIFFFYMSNRHLGATAVFSIIGFIEYLILGIIVGLFLFRRSTDSKVKTFFTLLFVALFMIVHGYMFGVIARGGGIIDGLFFVLFTIPTGFFISVMPSPTKKGQRIIDKIDGFKMYLSYAETHRLDKLNPPEITPQVFEKFLPYAHALGEENGWAEYFQNKFVAIQNSNYNYSPYWHRGNYSSFDVSSIGSSIGSTINSAMSSSTGSSSSSSSSGGGGGGGGGGGW
ncbi:hypothetical protein A9Q84_16270 [Halobacteriovorax marinus]|uniref:DUF2207 domain-containing protein n=1 Tax=Halobacteriovorax marinus TaxID=97084 RepID=A0A1Y5FA22_9BACT|nr:hypothetical protein A9Q84_16270 [Halobacteriovorax marinus]